MKEPATSKRRMKATAKQIKALELRYAGHSYQDIADAIGFQGRSGAFAAVMSALDKTMQEPADNVRELEIARLDKILSRIWTRVLNGEEKAIKMYLQIADRRAKYLGLDAPTKIETSGDMTINIIDDNESEQDDND